VIVTDLHAWYRGAPSPPAKSYSSSCILFPEEWDFTIYAKEREEFMKLASIFRKIAFWWSALLLVTPLLAVPSV